MLEDPLIYVSSSDWLGDLQTLHRVLVFVSWLLFCFMRLGH